MPTWHPHCLCFKAEALLRLNQIAEARAAVDRALAIAASGGVTWWDAELHRIRAAVIRAEGGGAVAVREALSHAVAIAEQQGSETFAVARQQIWEPPERNRTSSWGSGFLAPVLPRHAPAVALRTSPGRSIFTGGERQLTAQGRHPTSSSV
jgi:hypothetical protein